MRRPLAQADHAMRRAWAMVAPRGRRGRNFAGDDALRETLTAEGGVARTARPGPPQTGELADGGKPVAFFPCGNARFSRNGIIVPLNGLMRVT